MLPVIVAAAGVTAVTAFGGVSARESRRSHVAAFLESLPKAVTSSDGSVRVFARDLPGDEVGFRSPLLQFSTRLLRAFGAVSALELPERRRHPFLIIHALDGRTNDTRVIVRVAHAKSGRVETHVRLPSPGYSDLARLRLEIARAYYRDAVRQLAEYPRDPALPPLAEAPDWLALGTLRLAEPETMREDIRAARDRWAGGTAPSLPAMCRRADALPGVWAAFVTGWLKERRRLAPLVGDAAAGRVWSSERLARELTGEESPDRQDAACDYRFLLWTRKVVSPGASAPGDLPYFATHLRLHAPFFDQTLAGAGHDCSLREALAACPTDALVRTLAARKAREAPLHAIGRGEALQTAALAYRDGLLAIAGGDGSERAAALLDRADLLFEQAREDARTRKEMKR